MLSHNCEVRDPMNSNVKLSNESGRVDCCFLRELYTDFGVRIFREDQPATVMIGKRRLPIHKHRCIRGRRRVNETGKEENIGDTMVREHFVLQVSYKFVEAPNTPSMTF